MAGQKTVPTDQDVREFLDQIPDEKRRSDSYALLELLKEATGQEPVLWAGNIIGFGKYHYKYASGHEGDTCAAGFAPRKDALTLYTYPWFEGRDEMLDQLGKHKRGKGCVYIKRMSDIDEGVLRDFVRRAVAEAKAAYPDNPSPQNRTR